jgi:predicted membrane-bound spermidine synthase
MSYPGSNPTVPSITGFPVIDTLLKWAIGLVAMGFATWTMGWLSAHGYQNKYITSENLLLVVVPALIALATAVWAAISKYRTIFAFVEQVLEAAKTATVPHETRKLATPTQSIRIDRVNTAAAVGSRQADSNAGRKPTR